MNKILNLTMAIVLALAIGMAVPTIPAAAAPADWNGTNNFTYKVHDGTVDSNIATMTITVNLVNNPPVVADDYATTDEDTPINIDVLANDSDVEGDSLVITSITQPTDGSVTLNLDGTVTYDPNGQFDYLAVGEWTTEEFTYTVDDGHGGTDTGLVTITITGVNDAPVSNSDNYSTDEDTPLIVGAPGVLGNDTDVDGDTLTAILDIGAGHGTLALNADGSFSYTPDADWNGTDNFTYKANDGIVDFNIATVTITVNPVYDLLPAIGGIIFNDLDINGSQNSGEPGIDGISVMLSGTASLTTTTNSDGIYLFSGLNPGNYTVEVSLIGYDNTTASKVSFLVEPGNFYNIDFGLSILQPPIADAGGPYIADEGSLVNFDASGSSDPNGDSLEYRWDYENDGIWDTDWSSSPTASYTWLDNWSGTVMVEVFNGEYYDKATSSVTVLNVAPAVDLGPDGTIDEGGTFSSYGSFTDTGDDEWVATIEYGDDSGVQSLTLSDKTFSLNHTYGDNGTYEIDVVITDDDGGSGSDTVMVTVNNVAPTVNAGEDIEVFIGDVVNFSGSFTDPGWLDTHNAIWDYDNGTIEAGTITEENEEPDATGVVTGSHIYYQDGSYEVTLTVIDDDGGQVTDKLVVTVLSIPANIRFAPNTINLESEGKWVTVFIEFPEGPSGQEWDENLIDISSVRLNGSVSAETDTKYGFVKNSLSGNPELKLKFDRSRVGQVLEVGEEVEVLITGKVLYNGDYANFEGATIITVIDNGNKELGGSGGNGNVKDKAPGQQKEPGESAVGNVYGKEEAPGQQKEPGESAEGKAIGKENGS